MTADETRPAQPELTVAQRDALSRLAAAAGPLTDAQTRARADVRARLAVRGLAACIPGGRWVITQAGRDALTTETRPGGHLDDTLKIRLNGSRQAIDWFRGVLARTGRAHGFGVTGEYGPNRNIREPGYRFYITLASRDYTTAEADPDDQQEASGA